MIYGVATGDRPSTAVAVGIGLTVIGVVLAARPSSSGDGRSPQRADRVSVALALVAAVCFGGFMIALKAASEASTTWAVGFSRLTTVVLVAVAVLATASKLAVRGRDLPALVSVGALDVGATMLFAAATTKGLLSVVGVLGSFYPLVTVVLAAVVLQERLGGRQRFGALGALAGVALIAAG